MPQFGKSVESQEESVQSSTSSKTYFPINQNDMYVFQFQKNLNCPEFWCSTPATHFVAFGSFYAYHPSESVCCPLSQTGAVVCALRFGFFLSLLSSGLSSFVAIWSLLTEDPQSSGGPAERAGKAMEYKGKGGVTFSRKIAAMPR